MKPTPAQGRLYARSAKFICASAILGLAAGCATQPPSASATAPAAPTWTFVAQATDLLPGVYQSAYSTKTGQLYITSAVGRPPVRESHLMAFDPATQRLGTQVSPAAQASKQDGQLQAVYGIAVDDLHGQVWTTNTRSGSVAVYAQNSLALTKQFPDNATPHARDVVVDTAQQRAYVSSPASDLISVFDTTTLTPLPSIPLKGVGETPKPMSLALDSAHQRLYSVSLNTAEVFVIDTATGKQIASHPIPNAQGGAGIAVDNQAQQLYVAAQKSGNLSIMDALNGQILHQIPTGAGALNVAFDPVKRLAYVANRSAGTVTVVNTAGVIQAQIDTGSFPNHITMTPDGTAWALVKKNKDDPRLDRIVRIEARR
ncbi:YncE family protein [Castellaniella sp.]|uniref:YncE family protein n=1 Tax=Castellaniella sp. TaxID=1955812 RepID=UPI002AFE9B20|nr:YncE family protein [Castellaniella sp.]